jgi:hypothetical protein
MDDGQGQADAIHSASPAICGTGKVGDGCSQRAAVGGQVIAAQDGHTGQSAVAPTGERAHQEAQGRSGRRDARDILEADWIISQPTGHRIEPVTLFSHGKRNDARCLECNALDNRFRLERQERISRTTPMTRIRVSPASFSTNV